LSSTSWAFQNVLICPNPLRRVGAESIAIRALRKNST
jgi:hypothetical protein